MKLSTPSAAHDNDASCRAQLPIADGRGDKSDGSSQQAEDLAGRAATATRRKRGAANAGDAWHANELHSGSLDHWRAGWSAEALRGLTFEVRRDRRQSARPGGRMISLTWSRAWWFAVGPRLDRGVRPQMWANHEAWHLIGQAQLLQGAERPRNVHVVVWPERHSPRRQ